MSKLISISLQAQSLIGQHGAACTGAARLKSTCNFGDTLQDANTMCECGGNFQTLEYLLACPHIAEPYSNKDLSKTTDSTKVCAHF